MNPRPAKPVRPGARRPAHDGARRRPHPAAARAMVLVCALGALAGCHGNQQAHRDLYYREMRLQEDEIYRLEDCIKEYQRIIREYRVEVDELKAQLAEGAPTERARPRPAPSDRSLLDPGGADEPPPRDDEPEFQPPGIDIPQIDPGEPAEAGDYDATPPSDQAPLDTGNGALPPGVPEISVPPADASPTEQPQEVPGGESGELPPGELPPLEESDPLGEAPAFQPAPSSVSASAPVEDVTIASYSGPPVPSGEATLIALLQPLDRSGSPVRFNGAASLMLRDPSAGDEGEKIARWDFTPDEVADSWRTEAPTGVLDLAVVLPEQTPRDRKLELWVRLVDQMGGKSLAVADLTLAQVASIDQATLAFRPQPDDAGGDTEVAESGAGGAWRTATRPAAALADARPTDSGWRRSDAAPPVRDMVAPAAFEAPPQARPLPSSDDQHAAPPEWTPDREG